MKRWLSVTLLAVGALAGACASADSAIGEPDSSSSATGATESPRPGEPTASLPTTTTHVGSATPSVGQSDIGVVADLAYYESEVGNVAHLDVYHPSSGKDLPLVVLFHTNPVFGGSKEGMENLATMVAQRGAVVVVPSYGSGGFEPTEVARWFREQGPCAVWAAVDLAPSFGADASKLILFGEATGAFPVSTATFSPPSEVSGCASPPTDALIQKAIFFEQDWFFMPKVWDPVLADDPDYFATIQPWDDLASPTSTRIHIVVGGNTGPSVVRTMSGEAYVDSGWVRLRDPQSALASAWATAGTLEDDQMSFTDVSLLFTDVLVGSGWDASLMTIPGVGHSLRTDEAKTLIADLILEEVDANAVVVLDAVGCSSTIPSRSGSGALGIEIQNRIDNTMALVMGTYADGFGHDDLVAYGRDISTRPDFIDALEIYEVGPQGTAQVSFDHGPGRYFATCLDTTTTMIVLDDVTVAAE